MALNFWKPTTIFNLKSIIQNTVPQFLLKTSWKFCVRKYCVSVSTNQDNNNFMEFLNSSSPDTLKQHDLSPLLVQKIINEREIKNLTHDDMPTVGLSREKRFLIRTKLDLKHHSVDVEKLQSLIGNQSSLTKNENRNIKKFGKKSNRKRSIFLYTSPNLKNYNLEWVNTITSASLTHSHMCVTTFKVGGKIEEMRVIPLCIETNTIEQDLKNWKHHEICEKVLLATRLLPESDLLIFEKFSAGPNSRQNEPKNLQCDIVDVGSERVSCIDIGEEILTGGRPFTWIPKLTFSELALRRYILTTRAEKLQMIESLLLAIAFNSVYIKNKFGFYFSDDL
ncbi:hypothetical protein Anas_05080 [Armadillidium nasatum]|uniref:Uncharacterized protein n=1 Tax=Armadillidium nasatum TaxID=96803 RepID=A0A5N5TKL0_9CRUS|nr:hypothetical protein Anas_05080 [Armadillidium nasatum]